ncbi:MAG TPA: hypothetical protein VD930_11620, partial [Gemmatimonadales bacterium]|nr:hypothetical protein [Gemmatimonadales bacterium]
GYGNGSLDTTLQKVPRRAAAGHAFTSLAFAVESACGISQSGEVLCWGQNESGQLGDGTTNHRGAPAPVGGLTGIVELAAGERHFCARSGAGNVSCWGRNEWFQTGHPNRNSVAQPQPVALTGPASDIMAGGEHSCALVNGRSFCWGADFSGQLGNDTIYDRLVPALAATGDGVSRTWSEVEASNLHTCGRDAGGAVYCWGSMRNAATTGPDTLVWLPTIRFEGMAATDLAAGWEVQCAIINERAWCDGYQLPRYEVAASGPVSSVVVAGNEACVLQEGGAVACELVNNPHGALSQVPLPAPAVQLAANDTEVCALNNQGAVYCWWISEQTLAPRRKFQGLTATGVYGNSGRRTCIIAEDTTVACQDFFSEAETVEPTGGRTFVTLAVGDYHTCGLTAAGAAWCWGDNTHGQLGDGTTTNRAAAVLVQGGHSFSQITAGLWHTCGLTTAGAIYCWGRGSAGSMGDDNRDESSQPVDVDGAPELTQLGDGTCALDAAGAAWCWPRSLEVQGAQQITGASGLVSLRTPCGLRATGEMLCWGYNYYGWFGNGQYDVSNNTAVSGGSGLRFVEVSFHPYSASACGIALDGATYCWGSMFGRAVGSPESTGGMTTLPLKVYGSP